MCKTAVSVLCGMTFVAGLALAADTLKHNVKPKEGYVPNAETAIKIAVAVWEPIYGAETIAAEKPYVAVLNKDVWIVQGSLPEGYVGGVAIAEIAKDDGRILRVSHGK
jgi:hypothetical protein